jgi:hypothetical protein
MTRAVVHRSLLLVCATLLAGVAWPKDGTLDPARDREFMPQPGSAVLFWKGREKIAARMCSSYRVTRWIWVASS